mmetsp:Transcript_28141/g.50359  ORF Transcript_28141/g.50359 Transcript_28141/m.50359 type:complete len:96 (+) Transcript_28141:312-599(+)|eukprot:CAMPEP_0204915416 /NCGR_PEP_ID=MMETSP1397-20131031/13421_1 /ASSEMBLY_ACC=CAM_ASM_000891 /TAXON_ID=49980 /ORGANISM="Climacostomum Climacostomum virens, Strain Stock W-24" /LENGTH=95 /DNA_ID=CAMNT_0052087449 /DNA_START=172 /DNA_END=459 /DNA_ORIENTATION=+
MAEEIRAILADAAKLEEVTKGVFDQVDTDGSGQVSRSELKNALVDIAKEANLPRPSDEEVDKALAALDTDHSGSLSLDEFRTLVVEVLKALIELS